MRCRLAQAALIAGLLVCFQPIVWCQLASSNGSEWTKPSECSSSTASHVAGPAVTIGQLSFDGTPNIPPTDQEQISASLKQQAYWGDLDSVLSQVGDRAKTAWENRGYFKVQVQGDADVVTSSAIAERLAVTLHVEAGSQYRLKDIQFRGNYNLNRDKALRALFPIKDGDVFSREAIAEGLEKLRSVYLQYGYVNFTDIPDTQVDDQTDSISLEIDCDEGKQFFVSSIRVVGASGNRFSADSLLKPGMIYNERLAMLTLQKLAPPNLPVSAHNSRIHREIDENAATLAVTYDLRPCVPAQ